MNRLPSLPSRLPFALRFSAAAFLLLAGFSGANERIEVANLHAFAEAASGDNRNIRLAPGVYQMADYLDEKTLGAIREFIDPTLKRPPVPMMVLSGNGNTIDLRGVTLEIDTSLYRKIPQGGYTRCLIVNGKGNSLTGLTIRNTGENRGSGGNILTVQGPDNRLEEITLHVHGSSPYGYGDLLGKGGPNLVPMGKQSGILIVGDRTVLRGCRVISRAFGHAFYIQGGDSIRIEDCHAEGSVRATAEMLSDKEGPAFEQGFRSVYRNRDGRFAIVPGYSKSLSEDGFRTYSNAGTVTLKGCTATNMRAGFEIGAKDDSKTKTTIEDCHARGCERSFLIGSHTIVRRSGGDISHGPLLYLRGGRESDIELTLEGAPPISTVHAVATIAGNTHRVRLTTSVNPDHFPALPIMVGFGMPAHAEMSSPIAPAPAVNIDLESSLSFAPLLLSDEVKDSRLQSSSRTIRDAELRADPGPWDLPPDGMATGILEKKESNASRPTPTP